jgi:hypothetical protein
LDNLNIIRSGQKLIIPQWQNFKNYIKFLGGLEWSKERIWVLLKNIKMVYKL